MNVPALEGRVAVTEIETLGTPAFALALHTGGTIAGVRGNVLTGAVTPETPCPAAGAYHFVLSYAGTHADRFIPCRTNLAATGPVTYASLVPTTRWSLPV